MFVNKKWVGVDVKVVSHRLIEQQTKMFPLFAREKVVLSANVQLAKNFNFLCCKGDIAFFIDSIIQGCVIF